MEKAVLTITKLRMTFFDINMRYLGNYICIISLILLPLASCRETVQLMERATPENAIESANSEIWRRFVNEYDCLNDYTDLDGTKILPTAEECRDSKPNALAWWTPIENSSMYGGLYMDGIIKRWEFTKSAEDADRARRIAKGLVLLASVSKVEGFVARGVSADGVSHYPMGSNDQIGGWFYGLWRYLETDLPTALERKTIEDKMLATANAMAKTNWSIPAEPPFDLRGNFRGFDHNASRLLFLLKASFLITKDPTWNDFYLRYLQEAGGPNNERRIDIISKGLAFPSGKTNTWDESPSVSCMRLLWELEEDSSIKDLYRQGLENSATAAMQSLSMTDKYDPNDPIPYDLDWRKMNVLWRPQMTALEAEAVAGAELDDLNKRSPKRANDAAYIREPAFSAWVVSLDPNEQALRERKVVLERVITSYQYDKIYEVWFFPLIATWYRIQPL